MSAPNSSVPPAAPAPSAAAPARRGPLLWILGCLGAGFACSCLGVVGLLGLGAIGRPSSSAVGGPVAVAPIAEPNETPGTRTTIDGDDLVGTWDTSGAAVHVSETGAYVGDHSVATADRYEIRADGTYHEVFNGVVNGNGVHQEKTGTWAIQPGAIVFSPSGEPQESYWFRSYEIRADGGRTLTVLDGHQPNEHGYDLYAEHWSRSP